MTPVKNFTPQQQLHQLSQPKQVQYPGVQNEPPKASSSPQKQNFSSTSNTKKASAVSPKKQLTVIKASDIVNVAAPQTNGLVEESKRGNGGSSGDKH